MNAIGEVDQELSTVAADKASRMPHAMWTKLWGDHANPSHGNRPTTGSAGCSLSTQVNHMTNVKSNIVAGGDKGIVAGLVLCIQM
jgi:hypothetical protein